MTRLLVVILSISVIAAFWAYLRFDNQKQHATHASLETEKIIETIEQFDRRFENGRGKFLDLKAGNSAVNDRDSRGSISIPDAIRKKFSKESLGWQLKASPVRRELASPDRAGGQPDVHSDSVVQPYELVFSRSEATLADVGLLISKLRESGHHVPSQQIQLVASRSNASKSDRWSANVLVVVFVDMEYAARP